MRAFIKLLVFFICLGLLFAATFVLWGDTFEALYSRAACLEWFESIRSYAWAIAILLLIGDIFLPVPATGVMAALGSVYGFWLGSLISLVGFAGAGIVAYWIARLAGKKGAALIASEAELEDYHHLFDKWGGWAVICSRLMPILPEVVTLLAGFARMDFRKFTMALLIGSVPMALFFSWLGHVSKDEPVWGIAVSVVLPLLVWPLVRRKVSNETR